MTYTQFDNIVVQYKNPKSIRNRSRIVEILGIFIGEQIGSLLSTEKEYKASTQRTPTKCLTRYVYTVIDFFLSVRVFRCRFGLVSFTRCC